MYGQIQEDAATPAQRARMNFLSEQLHAIGLARLQARDRGDTVTDAALGKLAVKLDNERRALEAQIIAQTQKQQDLANAGAFDSPLERIAATVRKAAVIGGVGLVALVLLPPLLRNRRGSR
jgi:hypothetical protein